MCSTFPQMSRTSQSHCTMPLDARPRPRARDWACTIAPCLVAAALALATGAIAAPPTERNSEPMAEPMSKPAEHSPREPEAEAANTPIDAEGLVAFELLPTTDGVVPGQRVTLLLRMTVKPQWHTYWDGLNDTGFAPRFSWTLPDGWTIVAIEWPAPKRYISPGDILDHVYEGTATIIVTLDTAPLPEPAPPAATAPTSATVGVSARWLACMEACIPGTSGASVTLPILADGAKPAPLRAKELADARARVPSHLPHPHSAARAPVSATLVERDGGWALALTTKTASRIRYFPGKDTSGVPLILRQGDAAGPTSLIELDGEGTPDSPVIATGIVQIDIPLVDGTVRTQQYLVNLRQPPVDPDAAAPAPPAAPATPPVRPPVQPPVQPGSGS